MRALAIAAAAAVLALSTPSAKAFEIVYNGNFDLVTGGHADGWYGSAADWCDDWGVLYGNSVWAGGYDDAYDWLAQDVDFGVMPGTAFFSANTFGTSNDYPGYDFFRISIGPISTGWLDVTNYTGEHLWMTDVSTLMGTGLQTVLFEIDTDYSLISSLYIDKVSVIACPVPEPATMLVLGAGLAALAARRRK